LSEPAPPRSDPARIVERVLAMLDLERIDADSFRRPAVGGSGPRLFGGQLVAQALIAAARTVADDRPAHSLHGYFLRLGDPALPTTYEVSRLRDGGRFSTRHVTVLQDEAAIFSLSASFHSAEHGYAHQPDMPDVPAPESLQTETAIREAQAADIPNRRDFLLRHIPIDLRPVKPRDYARPEKLPPHQAYWFRPWSKVPDDPLIQTAFLAYLSDFMLLSTTLLPHGVHWSTAKIQNASLDHSLWLHAPPRFDGWMLYVQEAPWAGGARGLARGMIYDAEGRLVASAAQEGLIRLQEK
jgi:acyl-CoA thioesterase-2